MLRYSTLLKSSSHFCSTVIECRTALGESVRQGRRRSREGGSVGVGVCGAWRSHSSVLISAVTGLMKPTPLCQCVILSPAWRTEHTHGSGTVCLHSLGLRKSWREERGRKEGRKEGILFVSPVFISAGGSD